ncbi:Serine/Threonine kinase domain protein (macronuclear) [Tetrahymena thermophila SB210]|uniref:Casein kinase I n=1 Tax=Tetrahymena thermophila (strain SB210) TaxID=312017 RepID=I7M1J7_TETTS|nr:Serine/Threonine kinase domain protein [Tetrahymena thermophila SB210]EAR96474.1 Serine/Threonine kinase domain protein [Tetrahymena thermophila SB210]|eukprot:XP_001016719.1 Serine/Threonine kinase domain protein [Tetrahymena thermophila SB210]
MIGGQQERLKQEQIRENIEQLVIIKKELRNYPHLEVIEKIGQGSFGDIFKVWDSKRARWAAMKFEKKDKKNRYSLIKKEAQIMIQVKGSKYFAVLYDSRFSELSTYNFIEMSFLGPNLESLKKRMNGKFNLRTVLLIANQMISGLQVLHEKGIIHRDIKPENFVIGSEGYHHQVYIIDFGLSKYYIDENKNHIEQKTNKGLVGTARYTSINSHLGLEQSRRDDMESLAYLLLYFAKGTLVWQNLQFKEKEERFKKIAELKQTTPHEHMCRGLPKQFHEFLNLVKSLTFEQTPEYDRYRSLFSSCYNQSFSTPESQSCYDWCPKNCSLQAKLMNKAVSTKNLQDTSPQNNPFNSSKNIQNQNTLGNSQKQQIPSTPQIIDQKQISQTMIQQDKKQNQIEVPQTKTTVGIVNSLSNVQNGMTQSKNGAVSSKNLIPQNKNDSDLLAILNKQVSNEVYKKQLDNYDNNDDDNIDDIPVSEFRQGERKRIPIFRTEDNFSKHQQHAFSQLNLALSVNNQNDDKINTSNNLEAQNYKTPYLKKTHSFEGKIGLENSSAGNKALINHITSQNINLQTPNHLLVQPFSNSNIINKDSSQYPNNWSNEWNSEQDEKVQVQSVMPFNPSNNQQYF